MEAVNLKIWQLWKSLSPSLQRRANVTRLPSLSRMNAGLRVEMNKPGRRIRMRGVESEMKAAANLTSVLYGMCFLHTDLRCRGCTLLTPCWELHTAVPSHVGCPITARHSHAIPGRNTTFSVHSGEWAFFLFKISVQKHSWVFRKYFTPCLLTMIQIAFNRSEKVLGGKNPPLRISSVKAFMKDVIIKKWMNAFVSLWEVSEWLLFLSLFIPWRNWELIFAMPDWGY